MQRLPTPAADLEVEGPRVERMQVNRFMKHMAGDGPMYYWSSQVLFEPPFNSLDFQHPPPFTAADDFLTTWRWLRYLAPDLLQFIFYFRWLFIGPKGSYSRLHIDPAGSAAWNATLEGTKRFVFFHPQVMNDLHSDLSAPQAGRHLYPDYLNGSSINGHPGLELIAGPGDVVYAPPRWPHFVQNLSATVSVTENFLWRRKESYGLLDEALASAEQSSMPTVELQRIRRFRQVLAVTFALDRMLAPRNECEGARHGLRANGPSLW